MSNPYSVLGISSGASDEEVKTAYKVLARKYHPDNYANNPLADLAAEKMKEINAAYDEIMKQRSERRSSYQTGGQQSGQYSAGGQYSGGGRSGGYSQYRGYSQQSGGQFSDIRRLINLGRIVEAEEVLSGVPVGNRDAEWYFLKGQVLYARGWLDEARRHFSTAASMQPDNFEYQNAAKQFENAAGGYGYNGGSYVCCDPCTACICLNCLCNSRICCH